MINSDSTTAYPIDLTATRRDLAVGFLFSLCCLIGTIWVSQAFKSGPPVRAPREFVPNVQIVLPKADLDEQVVEETPQQTAPADIAPPMLIDVPQLAPPKAFTFTPEAPSQERLVDHNSLTVPRGIGAVSGSPIYTSSALDEQPKPTYQPAPAFPYDMKKAGVTGSVVVDFIVEPDGRVSGAYATTATERAFEADAVQAVMKWRFHPGRRGGRAVRTRMSVPINFILEDR